MSLIAARDRCPTCGAAVSVHASDEGTCWFDLATPSAAETKTLLDLEECWRAYFREEGVGHAAIKAHLALLDEVRST